MRRIDVMVVGEWVHIGSDLKNRKTNKKNPLGRLNKEIKHLRRERVTEFLGWTDL